MKSNILLITFLLALMLTACEKDSAVEDNYVGDKEQSATLVVKSIEQSCSISEENGCEETQTQEIEGVEDIPVVETESSQEIEVMEPQVLHFIDAWDEWHDAEIDSSVPMHDYDWNCLSNTEEGIFYENDERYEIRKGIDVSYHQGKIDWDKVKAAGYEFAIIRVGYRGYGVSGSIKVDKEFHDNIKNAQRVGMDVGVYFFSQAINEEEAKEEAEFVLQQLSGLTLQLPVVYDPELIRHTVARTDNVTGEQFTENTLVFCDILETAGYETMIYSNMVWEAFIFDMQKLSDYTFWYADYEKTPQTPYKFTFWQYTCEGIVDGIDGYVDLNVQFVKKE